MFRQYNEYSRASVELIKASQKIPKHLCDKSIMGQSIYLSHNIDLYTEDERDTIKYFLDAFLYKFQLASYSLEQLWSLHYSKIQQNMLDIMRNSISSLELSDEETFLQSHAFEQFLFQGRACLDFYMLYLVHILRTDHQGSMSTSTFYKRLKRADTQLKPKANKVEEYFQSTIFSSDTDIDHISPTNWGTLLKSLRDKIAHKDRIRISKNSHDLIMNDILLDFPTLKDLTYDRFCQAMQNGIFYMIQDLFPIIYELEWKPGPYEEGMWD